MSRNDSFISECYSSINEMESVVMESELDVVGSIVDAYDKLASIYENAEDDVDIFMSRSYLESYSYFEESNKTFGEKFKERFDEGSVLQSIIKFIPNLVRLIIDSIKKIFNKKKGMSVEKAANFMSNAAGQVKKAATKLWEAIDLDKDNTGKIVAISVAGFTIPAAVVFGFTKKGREIVKMLANSFVKFWTGSVPAFFSRKINDKTIPDAKKIGKIDYIETAEGNKYTTHVNLGDIYKFFNEPIAVIQELARIQKIDDRSLETINACSEKISTARKINVVTMTRNEYGEEEIINLIEKINDAIARMQNISSSALNNITNLANSYSGKQQNPNPNPTPTAESWYGDDICDYIYQEADDNNADTGNTDGETGDKNNAEKAGRNKSGNNTNKSKAKIEKVLNNFIKNFQMYVRVIAPLINFFQSFENALNELIAATQSAVNEAENGDGDTVVVDNDEETQSEEPDEEEEASENDNTGETGSTETQQLSERVRNYQTPRMAGKKLRSGELSNPGSTYKSKHYNGWSDEEKNEVAAITYNEWHEADGNDKKSAKEKLKKLNEICSNIGVNKQNKETLRKRFIVTESFYYYDDDDDMYQESYDYSDEDYNYDYDDDTYQESYDYSCDDYEDSSDESNWYNRR